MSSSKYLVVIILYMIPQILCASSVIAVLPVFPSDAPRNIALGIQYEELVNNMLADNNISNKEFRFWDLGPQLPDWTAEDGTKQESINHLLEENANPSSFLRNARDAVFGGQGADLVMMIADSFIDGGCGQATNIPLSVSRQHSEDAAFSLINRSAPCSIDLTIAHELMHNLYAEHDSDTNGNSFKPRKFNHAGHSAQKDSVMWFGESSRTVNLLSGTNFPGQIESTEFSDNKIMITAVGWDPVSNYRPPAGCNLRVEFTGCGFGGNPTFLVTPTATIGGIIQDIILQSRIGSTISTIYQGILTCPSTPGTLGSSPEFIAQMNTSNGIALCTKTISIPVTQCDSPAY